MRENAVERRLIKKVKEAGGTCMKIMPVVAGYPDRLVLLPRNRLFFIETKAPKGGVLRPVQQVFIDRAGALGIPVAVLKNSAEVDAWVAAHIDDPLAQLAREVRDWHLVMGSPFATRLVALLDRIPM